MKILILAPVGFLFLLLPGDVAGYPHGAAYRPAPAYHPAPFHTPAFVAPRYSAPRYAAPHYNYGTSQFIAPHYNYSVPQFVAPRYVAPRPVMSMQTVPGAIYRPGLVTGAGRPIVTTPRPVIGNNFATVNRATLTNRGVYINRPNGYYRPGYAHYHDRYAGWHHGYWHGWYARPWLWLGTGLAAGWLWDPGENIVYDNPYYFAPPPQVEPVYDYSQPIQVSAPTLIEQGTGYSSVADQMPLADQPAGQAPPPPAPPDAATNATAATVAKLVDDARQAFIDSDYVKARQLIDQAIKQQPNDTTLHEFRALTLFAQAKYAEAAENIYAVLAVGPGWDWKTLLGLYPDVSTYTKQLRALEQFTKDNPKDAASRFLLAYQYLVMDFRDAAIRTLESVVALQPKDQVAGHLLKMLNKKQPDRPTPGT